ncbi:nuclear transport factor 2 family protein [Photobacterium nomapromontoriensis]|uniref:nuclear transport factor 2 family protein n=1 Tax=Photobacterium nomapromontoriensis TaxID=2910237 RepID=UPI003D0ED805
MVDKDATALIDRFARVYSDMDKDNVSVIADIYHDDVIFEDPVHRIEGLSALMAYFERLFKSVDECQFQIHESISRDDVAYLQWTMLFSHSKLFHGRLQKVVGCSRIQFSGEKVIQHRDYFDMGQMIYEGIPFVGALIRKLKSQV